MSPLRLVQVGAGSMGRTWLRTITQNPEVELVGLVDLDPDVARRAVQDLGLDGPGAGLTVGTSVAEIARQTGAEALVNVTVPGAHRQVSNAALLAGLPVLCEKPIAASVAEGLSMAAAADAGGQLLMISQSRRYFRPLTALRRQLGRLGTLGIVQCDFYKAPHFGGFRDAMDHPLLVDMAIHQFDLARDLIGSDPVSVHCESFNPSWSWYAGDAAARVSFEFAGGCRFGFSGSWCSGGLETSWNGSWRISGSAGSAVWDGDHDPQAALLDGTPVVEAVDPITEQTGGALADFVAALRTGRTPPGEAHDNVISLAMVEGAIRSAETGARVRLADVLDAAYRTAVGDEPDPQVAKVLRSWNRLDTVLGRPGAG